MYGTIIGNKISIYDGIKFGNINDKIKSNEIKQISCGYKHLIIYSKNNEIWVLGSSYHGQLGLGNNENQNIPILLMKDDQIKQICCGSFHSMIYKKNGELLVFGYNYYGQLGIGTYVP